MSTGKIFVRERRNVEKKTQTPRFNVVAIAGADVQINSQHLRKKEIEEVAKQVGAELVYLEFDRNNPEELNDADDE